MLFKQTLLPEPVVPAIMQCGIALKSANIGSLTSFIPMGIEKLPVFSKDFSMKRGSVNKSFNGKIGLTAFGIDT